MSHERYGEDTRDPGRRTPDPRRSALLLLAGLACGLLFALAAYRALRWDGDPADASCAGGRDHGWTACEPGQTACAPRGLPCRTSAPRD